MADRDINIHVRTPGAKESKQQLDTTAEGVQELGQTVNNSGQHAEQAKSKFDIFGRVLGRLKSEVIGMITVWFSISAVIRLIDSWSQSLAKLRDLIKANYEESLKMMEVGQRIEIQTGTVGKQKEWAKTALSLQSAGGISDTASAESMITSAHKAYGPIGGLNNKDVQRMLYSVAPYFGMTQTKPEDVDKILSYAAQQGVQPTPQAMWDFLGKLQPAIRQTGSVENAIKQLSATGIQSAPSELPTLLRQSQHYMQSLPTKEVQRKTKKEDWQLETGEKFASLEDILRDSEQKFNELFLAGEDDPAIPNAYESYIIAARTIRKKLESLHLQGEKEQQRRNLIEKIDTYIERADWHGNPLRAALGATFPDQEVGDVKRFHGAAEQLIAPQPQQAPSTMNINHYNNTYINQTPPDAQPRSNGGL